jgi:post-segregation antitoxin (ccd killing protein)
MQVTVDIPDTLAAHLRAAGLDPAAAAQQVLSAEAYQHLLDEASLADEREGARQADEDIAAGRIYPAREVFDEMRKRYDIPR